MFKPNTQRLIVTSILLALASPLYAAEATGAGASFPSPVYNKWSDAYFKATGNRMNYQSIGSGSGIRQISNKTVDFATTDIPLNAAALSKNGLVQFPALIGGAVPIVNLPGVEAGQLRLSGPVLADIFLGKIRSWRDPAITSLNSGVKLPDMSIAVVHRWDGAGSTLIFTNYLSKISPDWKTRVGSDTTVQWPVGMRGKGDDGVTHFINNLPGSIGYVEYAYAQQNKLNFVSMQNHSGNFVVPNDSSLQAAAAEANWEASSFGEIITDQNHKDAWPLAGATFVLMRTAQDRPVVGAEVLKFFQWAYANGGNLASSSGYVPLPGKTVGLVGEVWRQIKDPNTGKPVLAP